MAREGKRPMSFRLSDEAAELLREAAEMDRRSMTKALEVAIEDYHAKVMRDRGEPKAA